MNSYAAPAVDLLAPSNLKRHSHTIEQVSRRGVAALCSIRMQTKRHFYPLQKESSSKARTYTSLAHT